MNNRERIMAVLSYTNYDRLPVVHFGFWRETLRKWAEEGHVGIKEAGDWNDGNIADNAPVAAKGQSVAVVDDIFVVTTKITKAIDKKSNLNRCVVKISIILKDKISELYLFL